MPIDVLMPALSPTMEVGTLRRWLVKEGSEVRAGDVIGEIETDKATMEIEASDDGIIQKIVVPDGTENVKVNALIAVLTGEDESDNSPLPPKRTQQSSETVQGDAVSSDPAPDMVPKENPTNDSPREKPSRSTSPRHDGHRKGVSPYARKLAHEVGLDVDTLAGTGTNGRVVARDVLKARGAAKEDGAAPGQTAKTTSASAMTESSKTTVRTTRHASPTPLMTDAYIKAHYDTRAYDVVPHDTMRSVIAERLTYSKQNIPHYRLKIDCEIDELLRARKRLNALSPKDGPKAYRLSVNDFIIKALGLALQQVPSANCSWTQSEMLHHKYSDVGVAVAVDGGLYTPIIRNCELKTLSEISNEMKELAARAREKRLAPQEYQGGATSISNLGMYGIDSFDAVINPPQSSILAVGSGTAKSVVRDGQIAVATVMSCALSCDHRVIDGAVGAEFLAAFKAFVEDPVNMLI